MAQLPNPQLNPVVDGSGKLAREWVLPFQQMLNSLTTTTDSAAAISALQAAIALIQSNQAADEIDIAALQAAVAVPSASAQDVADLRAEVIMRIRPPPALPTPDDAQWVIAHRVFA